MSLYYHINKKRKNSLEGSLARVLFALEPEFSKILIPENLNNCIIYVTSPDIS